MAQAVNFSAARNHYSDRSHSARFQPYPSLSPARVREAIASSSSSSSYSRPGRVFSTGGRGRGENIALDRSIIAMRDNLAEERGWAGWERLCDRNFEKFSIPNCTNAFYSAAGNVQDKDKQRFLQLYGSLITRLLNRIKAHLLHDDPKTIDVQSLTNTIWALANFQYQDPELIQVIAAKTKTLIGKFNEQNCSNAAWAFANLGLNDRGLFADISHRTQTLIENFTPQGLCSIAMAFAKMEFSDVMLFKAITEKAKVTLRQFDQQALCNLAWAYAKAKMDMHNPLSEIITELRRRGLLWDQAGIMQIIKAIGNLKAIEDRAFIRDIMRSVQQNKSIIGVDHLSFACWSFAVIFNLYDRTGVAPTAAELEILHELLCEIDQKLAHLFMRKENINSQTRAQINQTLLYLEHFQPRFYRPDIYAKVKLAADEYTVLSESGFERPESSLKHKEIHAEAERILGHVLSMEQFESGYFLDTILDEERKIVLEVVGQFHFLASGGVPGEMVLRDRILKKAGWTTIEISALEWQDVPLQERRQYLQARLPAQL